MELFQVPPVVPPPVPAASQGDLLQLLGALYGAASIIVVFQMFSLQLWYQRVHELDDVSFDAEQSTVLGSLERLAVIGRIRAHRRGFPWFQLVGCATALLALLAVSSILAAMYQGLSWYFTIGPVLVLTASFVGVTTGTIVRGFQSLAIAIERLE